MQEVDPAPEHTPSPGAATSMPRFTVVDIETSGLSPGRHRILQVAAVTVDDGEVVDEWSSLIRLRWPLQRVGPRRVHGISRRQLRSAPQLQPVLAEFAERIDGTVFTAHNVDFDWPFLERAARSSGVALNPAARLCTLQLSRWLDPDRELSHRLADVGERYGVVNERAHDALHDARATSEVLPHLLAAHEVNDGDDLGPLYVRS